MKPIHAAHLADLFDQVAEIYREIACAEEPDLDPLADLRFVEANAIQQAKGLIGWVYGTHAGRALDALRVLRADDGRYVAEFSNRGVVASGPGGGDLPDHDQDLISEQVLGELRRRGALP